MRSYKTEAIILKRRNFGEADRILTTLTPNYGKIQVRAPGVRKITSRRSPHVEPLNISIFSLYKSSRSLIPIVTEAQCLEDFSSIKNNLGRIIFSYYICELVDELCAENQENRRVFFLVRDTLLRLASFKVNAIQESFSRHSGPLRPPRLGEAGQPAASPRGESASEANLSRTSLRHGDSGCGGTVWHPLIRMTDSEKGLSIVSDFEDELLVSLGFLPRQHKVYDKRTFVENILEKKLNTRRLLPLFLDNSES